MLDVESLKRELLATGRVTTERLASAETEALAAGTSLGDVLVRRLMISFPDLGLACSRVTGLPYIPLSTATSDDQPRWMSMEFAAGLGVYPLDYDPMTHELVVAVTEPAQGQTVGRLLQFLDQQVQLTLTVASDVEMARELERARPGHVSRPAISQGVRPPVVVTEVARRVEPAGGGGKGNPVRPTGTTTGGNPPAKAPASRGPREPAYGEMSEALAAAVSLLARQRLADEPDAVHVLRTRVRYSQLMASRLKFSRVETDALVIAAWLSGLREEDGLVEPLTTPYGLYELLQPDRARGARPQEPRAEALVLGLVRCYQNLRDEKPEAGKDVNLVRRELFLRWPTSRVHPNMLETFLQILVDEEFLETQKQVAGRILIVDPDEAASCALSPPLVRLGYDVMTSADTRAAREALETFKPDLVMINVDAFAERALWFCERMRGDARTATTPLLALVGPAQADLAVKCMRAGCADVLTRPIHTELLALKVQHQLSEVGVDVRECGVSGSLDEMGFTDMVQILCAGRRSVDVFLNAEADEGRVYIREGDVVHAMLGALRGEPAFYAMMRWKHGTFTTRQCGELPERSIHVSAMALLMEGARQLDESSP